MYYLHSSKQNKEYLEVALSDESKRKRNRQYKISIQTTFLSWSLEFMMACFVMIFYYIFKHNLSQDYLWILWPFFIFQCSVAIPGSYLLKTENSKSIIARKGWCNPCRACFQVRNPRAAPREEIEMHVNPQQDNKYIPPQVPTISRTVSDVQEAS